MNAALQQAQHITRRHFLRDCQVGLGGLALASLAAQETAAAPADTADNPLAVRQPHFEPKAKNVIFLHMAGSPPHLDLLDYKPELVKRNDEACPDEFIKGKKFAFTSGTPKLLGTPHKFAQYGESGAWVSDALPHIAGVVDDLTIIHSMNTDQFNHAPAQLMLYTGSPRMGRPALGAWATYGLGSENENLPGYVVLISGGTNPSAGKSAWGSGFLPSVYQGVQCRSQGDPVLFLSNPKGMDRPAAAAESRCAEGSESAAGAGTGQPGNNDADRPVRTRFPHAGHGTGSNGRWRRNEGNSRSLRSQTGRRQLCQ